MSDDEMERFEITDYDLDNEFNVNRPRKKLTKNQQMLGIWAESDEEDARPSFKMTTKKPKNYSAPVSFVAGGIQQAGQPKEEKKDEEDEENDDDESKFIRGSSSDSDNERPSMSTKSRSRFSLHTDADIAGLRKKRSFNPKLAEKGVGSWEVHTKGIGAKLLLQMGFQPGKGLGKQLQGISAPVEAHVRKGRGAIGAYGPEKAAKVGKLLNEEDEEVKDSKPKTSQWRKADAKKKVTYAYRSVDQLLEDSKSKPLRKSGLVTEMSKVKVIDMTGPEQRVLSGYHAIASSHQRPDDSAVVAVEKKTCKNFALPELTHNLNILVDQCEQEIIQNDRRKRYLGDRIVALDAEKKALTKAMTHTEMLMKNSEYVLGVVEKLVDPMSEVSLSETAQAFKNLQDNYYEEYKMFDLGNLASSLVGTKMKNHLSKWNPLNQPTYPLKLFKEWKDILECGKSTLQPGAMNPYDQLVWHSLMPSIRGAIHQWDCRHPEELIVFLEDWLTLIPSWILENILDLQVLPKLTLEVEDWNPVIDTVPIHTWIHPWLPLIKNRLGTDIYPIIRRKLGSALGGWHPSDRSARLMLEPWSQVFSKNDMEAFLVKNIVPKLQVALTEFVINPHQQHLEHWNWVIEWKELLPVHTMANLLDKFFFPKWLQVLAMWLNHNPNYEQITNWYMGWKGMLDNKLLDEPVIKEHFKKALNIMNRAVASAQGLPPGAAEQISYLTSIERTQSQPQISSAAQPRMERLAEAVKTSAQIPQGFKDIVQKRCEERGILFMPIPNKHREGKVVYKIGKVQAYIDGNKLYACHNGVNWMPTSLNTLLDTAED